MMLKPVQILPVAEAKTGALSTGVPQYDASCSGCRLESICRERGAQAAFRVDAVIGQPVFCRKANIELVACRATPVEAPKPEPVKAAPKPKKETAAPALAWYVVDASVFINAGRWKWEQCIDVLQRAGLRYALATTKRVKDELHHSFVLPRDLDVLDIPDLDPELVELAYQNRYPDGRQASPQDLSLVQVLLRDPRFKGIITEDEGLRGLHPASFIEKRTGRKVEVLNCEEFRARHQKYFRGGQ